MYETYTPRAGDNKTHNITLWGCTLGSTTITATLTFQGPDDFESSEIGEATFPTTVVLPPPPAPTVLTIVQHSTYPEWVRITWNRRAGIGHHDIYRRVSGEDDWDDVGTYTITRDTIDFSVSLPECGTTYEFQVGATGDGITYARTETRSRTRSIWRACPPPEISITRLDSSIDEGDEAEFRITSSYALSDDLEVSITVTEDGDYIDERKPTEATIAGGTTRETIGIDTDDDDEDERNGSITVTLVEGTDYDVDSDSSSASITIRDDDLPEPRRPSGLRVSRTDAAGEVKVTVRWNRSTDAEDYRVQRRSPLSGRYITVDASTDDSTSVELSAPCSARPYYFRVAAYGDGREAEEEWGDYSSEEAAPTCPAAPTGLDIGHSTYHGRNAADVTWNHVTGATEYLVERGIRNADGDITFTEADSLDTLPSRADGGQEPRATRTDSFRSPCGQVNYFRVAAMVPRGYDNSWGAFSALSDAPLCTVAAPYTFGVESRTPYSTTLEWSAVSGAQSYTIERSRGGASFWQTVSSSISSTATSYTVTSLKCGEDYDYRISAPGDGTSYASGYGDLSTVLEVSGTGDSACPLISIEPPTDGDNRTIERIFEDTDATFTVTSDQSVNRSLRIWIAVVDDGQVISGAKPTRFTFPANSTSATLTIMTDDDTNQDGAGSITVRLVDTSSLNDYNLGSGTSASLIIDDDDLDEPPIPEDIEINRVFGHEVDVVQFSHGSVDGARNYVVQRGTSSDPNNNSFSNVLPYRQTQPESRSLFTSDLYTAPCDTTSYFRVAVEGDGEALKWIRGSFSTPLATPPCKAPPPDDFRVVENSATDSTITLNWTALTGAASYKIERSPDNRNKWNLADESSGSIASTETTYTVTGLSCNTRHFFRISSRGDGGNDADDYPVEFGDPSNGTHAGTTTSCPVVSISAPTPTPDSPSATYRIFEGGAADFTFKASTAFARDTEVSISVSTSKAAVDGTRRPRSRLPPTTLPMTTTNGSSRSPFPPPTTLTKVAAAALPSESAAIAASTSSVPWTAGLRSPSMTMTSTIRLCRKAWPSRPCRIRTPNPPSPSE